MNLRKAQIGWIVAAAACSSVALFGAEGCTITTGGDVGDGSFPDVDVPDTGNQQTTPLDLCYGCLFDQCAGQWASCQGDVGCNNIYTCSTKASCVGDENCRQTCYNAGSDAAKSIYISLAACDIKATCTTCSTLCSAAGAYDATQCVPPDAGAPDADAAPDAGSGSDPTVPPAQSLCNICTQQACGVEKAACSGGTDCDKYQLCVSYCATRPDSDIPQCLDDCGNGFAEGKTAADALGKCNTDKCGKICGYNIN